MLSSLPPLPHALLPLLLDVSLKGAVVLGGAGLAALLLRRASAASRHLIWLLALAGLMLLPLLSLAVPRWNVPAPWARDGGEAALTHSVRPLPLASVGTPAARRRGDAASTQPVVLKGNAPRSDAATPPILDTAPGEAASPPMALVSLPVSSEAVEAEFAVDAVSWILGVWLLGVLFGVGRLAVGLVRLQRLLRRCRPVTGGPMFTLLSELAARLGVRRSLRLVTSGERSIPMTWGLFRPVVLLPEEAAAWSADRLRVVLLHELGHVRRWDCLTQMLAQLLRAAYWFHPLVWLAVARLRAEQERACDDLVLETGANAADYAEHLLTITASLPPNYFVSPVALGMARFAPIQRRLQAILDPRRNRRPVRPVAAGLAAAACLALLLPLAGLAFRPAEAIADTSLGTPTAKKTDAKQGQDAGKENKKIEEIRQKLLDNYVKPLDGAKLTQDAIKGLLAGLKDPYTEYLSPEVLKSFDAQVQGEVVGVGIQIHLADKKLTVLTPLEDSPAFKAGLRPGDVILSVDGKATAGLTLEQAVKLILGPKGSVVKLRVQPKGGGETDVAITRDVVRFRMVQGFRRGDDARWDYYLDPETQIGYAQVLGFNNTTTAELRETLGQLQKKGLKGLILDLRFCPGGLLNQAVETARLFLPKGIIVTVRGSKDQDLTYRAEGKEYLGDFPLVVLVNEQTASAAEILAGALKDNGRAVLVGTRTYGKGSIQTLLALKEAGGALKLTTAHHFLPSGRNIQKQPGEMMWGVDPTDGYYVPVTAEQVTALRKLAQARGLVGAKKEDLPFKTAKITPKVLEDEHADPQLAAALRTLTARVTGGAFIKVGKANGVLFEQLQRLEDLRKRRETIQQDLQQLNQDIEALEKILGREKK